MSVERPDEKQGPGIATGDVERGIVGSHLTADEIKVTFGDQYISYSSVLLRQELYLIPDKDHPEIVAPSASEIDTMNTMLKEEHFALLSAPAFWRSSYVAEYLAAKRDPRAVYTLSSEASGQALYDSMKDMNYDLKNAVILASGVRVEKYTADLIPKLIEQAKTRKAYLILTTEADRAAWQTNLSATRQDYFFDLRTASPYTTRDLVQWLQRSPIFAMWLARSDKTAVTEDETLPELNLTLHALAQELGSPGALQQFLNALRPLLSDERAAEENGISLTIRDVYERVLQQRQRSAEQRIEEWFNSLDEPEKYLVLAISLLDGLQQETFWAIYEQLTRNAWRERDMQLAMSDYHDIEVKLDQFVSATGDRVSFHNAEERRKLVAYALDGYRRSLVQALPVLADIVSGANQPVTSDSGSLAGRLRILDIFGSELEPTGENRQRQERLRNSIANSIAQIAQREPATTQHLLLAWASGVGDTDSNIVNMRLRIAVTITLVQMLTIEAPAPPDTGNHSHWRERHIAFQLLVGWYERYRAAESSRYIRDTITDERHRNIRGTMALALCHIGRHMTEADFGSLDTAVVSTNQVPDEQPASEKLQSLWDMLLALAWDPDSHVRASILEGIPVLMQRHPAHADKLIQLLASDWQRDVRMTVAETLAGLYVQDAASIYLINHLFSTPDPLVDRNLPADADHYLRRETLAYQHGYPAHLWTVLMALFIMSDRDSAVFQTYLDRICQPNQSYIRSALDDVLHHILSDEQLTLQFQDTALLYVLKHTDDRNVPSEASQSAMDAIRSYISRSRIERNATWFRKTLVALARNRHAGLPDPTTDRLRQNLNRLEIHESHIDALLRHYMQSNDERLRRRIQAILISQNNGSAL